MTKQIISPIYNRVPKFIFESKKARFFALIFLLNFSVFPSELAGILPIEIDENPVIARIWQSDQATATSIIDAAHRILADPPGATARRSNPLDDADSNLVQHNPLLGRVMEHNPAAGLELLRLIQAAAGRRQ